jgi:Flp pilus assembly protein TadD
VILQSSSTPFFAAHGPTGPIASPPGSWGRGTRPQLGRIGACAAILLSLSAAAYGDPYVPRSDHAVVERIQAAGPARALAPLREAVAREPRDLASALQLARGYLEISRRTSDPRFVSYALSTLAPWSLRTEAPASVLVLEATALQSLHRFGDALARLDRALELEPRNAQAWLTKAALLQVRGDFVEARAACRSVAASADARVALTCLASVDGMTGRLRSSYEALTRASAATANESGDAGLGGWIEGQLGEMALRLGDFSAAEAHLRAALRHDPDDPYLLASYADLLLLQSRTTEAASLLRSHVAHDVLLLRLAIAARRSGAPEAARWTQLFDARRRAARAADNPHLREHGRFMLDVLVQPQEALDLARRNWAVQREPADIALYLRAARVAGSAADERVVTEWIRRTGYEDRTLGALAEPRIVGTAVRL